jgi:hypothetical protein
MKLARLFPILVLALALAACGGGGGTTGFSEINQGVSASAGAPAPQAPGGATALESGGAPKPAADQAEPGQQPTERLVIKSAELSLEVADARTAEADVRGLVAKLGGYVVRVQTSGSDENMSSTITFRVPAARFDEALSGVQGLAKKVFSRTVSGDDVTEEFVDLESRLKNLEATRDRLQAFLDKAANVDEALKVNQSLSEIQGQIEQIKGRQQFLKQSAALSTITVSLSPVPPPAPIVAEDSWQPLAVARGALRGLIGFGQGLANVAIVLLVWSPVWIILALAALWLRRRFLGRAPKPSATSGD